MTAHGSKLRTNCVNPNWLCALRRLKDGIHETIFAAKLLANPLLDFLHHTVSLRYSLASQPIEATGAALCLYSATVYAQFCSFKENGLNKTH